MSTRGFIVGLTTVLILGSRSVATPIPANGSGSSCLALLQSTCRTLVCVLSQRIVECCGGTSVFAPQADGGGDGGGDGGSGTGGGDGTGGDGSASDGGGDSGGVGGDTSANSDDSNGTVADPSDPGDPGNNNDVADPSALSDPTTVANNTVVDVPTNDPALGLRGPGSPGSDVVENEPVRVIPPSLSVTRTGVAADVGINAVIVSGAPTPWEAIGKVPGVRNVVVTGAIVALGDTTLAKPPIGVEIGTANNPPEWLGLKPDLRYLNGSLFPPVVPNVIDIRIVSYTEEVIQDPQN